MRVIVNPGLWRAYEAELAQVMTPDSHIPDEDRLANLEDKYGQLVALLVEKGALTLTDCQALGGPYMEPAE